MHLSTKSLFSFLLSTSFLLFLSAFRFVDSKPQTSSLTSLQTNIINSSCYNTPEGTAIDWDSSLKLKHTDFKAGTKWSFGNKVASTYSGFGYSITDDNGNISGSIFVRFYCNKSWWNPELNKPDKITYILKHEQLHFDICELFGRKLYKEILRLRDSGRLNSRTIDKLQTKLEKQYDNYQDKYDKKTNHSINRVEQYYWSKLVKTELEAMSEYSDYNSF